MIQQQSWISLKLFRLFLYFLILTIILLSVAAYQYYTLQKFFRNSAFAWGKMVVITQKNNSKDSTVHFLQEISEAEYRSLVNYYQYGKYSLYPTIEFIDQKGNKQRFVSKQYFPSKLLGSMEKIEVRYDPSNPHIAMIDTPRNYQTIFTWIVLASFPGSISLAILLCAFWRKWVYY